MEISAFYASYVSSKLLPLPSACRNTGSRDDDLVKLKEIRTRYQAYRCRQPCTSAKMNFYAWINARGSKGESLILRVSVYVCVSYKRSRRLETVSATVTVKNALCFCHQGSKHYIIWFSKTRKRTRDNLTQKIRTGNGASGRINIIIFAGRTRISIFIIWQNNNKGIAVP